MLIIEMLVHIEKLDPVFKKNVIQAILDIIKHVDDYQWVF